MREDGDLLLRAVVRTSETAVISEMKRQPENFALHPNYPNPFNATTMISFDITANDLHVLRIINMSGDVVYEQRFSNAGHYSLRWDGKARDGGDVPSGVYLAMLQSEKAQQSQKMTLLR